MAGRRVITPKRRIGSVLLGAVLGGVIMALPSAFLISERLRPTTSTVVVSIVVCIAVWLAGITAIAFPVWRALETRKQPIGWRSAALLGAILGIGLGLAMSWGLARTSGVFDIWFTALAPTVFLGVLGALVGLAMWRFGYREAHEDVAQTFS